MKLSVRSFAVLVAFLCIFTVWSLTSSARSQNESDARFTDVHYSARVHSGTSSIFRFTVYNANCSENDQGAARFSLEIYMDGVLYYDEYNSTSHRTWWCNKSQTVTRSFEITEWSTIQPAYRDLKVNLYWFNDGAAHLEDTTSFTVAVTMLIPFQHIYAAGYIAVYVLACFLLFAYDYVAGLAE